MIQFIESELEILRSQLNEMWSLVYNQLDRAGEAVLTNNRELASRVIKRERRVNAFELKIDRDIEEVIELYNPVGVDLRFVLAVFKINSNLERIGDFADSIAQFVNNNRIPAVDADLYLNLRMTDMVQATLLMLEKAKCAFDEENVELTSQIFEKDNLVDEINQEATKVMAAHIKNYPDDAEFCLELTNVIRRLERTGDHITNIAEEIVFYVDAKVLKHGSIKSKG
ncbi:MAG: phosphate signaling complex protein PhoU [Bacteroidaceae bacterium]